MRTCIIMSLLLLLCVGNATAKMDYPKLEMKFSNSPDKDKILNECKSYLQKMEGVLKDTAIYNTTKKKRIASETALSGKGLSHAIQAYYEPTAGVCYP